MLILREGAPVVVGATGVAVVALALALRVRSWPLWLVGFGSLLAALAAAWAFRTPVAGGGG
jgi:hypothetical protein